MALPLLIPLAVLAAKGLAGIGTGAAANKALGGKDYSKSDALVDFGLGAVAFPGAGRIKDVAKVAPKFIPGRVMVNPSGKMFATDVAVGRFGRPVFLGPASPPSSLLANRLSGPLSALAYNAGGRKAATARSIGLSMLPFGGGALGSYIESSPSQPLSPQPNITSPSTSPVTSTGTSEIGKIRSLIDYTPGKAPTFNKTLADYMKDQTLRDIVQQNINATNMPLFSANKATRKKMANEIAQNNYIARTLQADYNKRIADQQSEMKLMQDRDNARQQAMLERSAIAESDVPLTYVSGEAATAKRETTEAAANEQAMSDALIDRLAGSANEYLKELQLAQRSESSAQGQGIRQKADEEIATAMAQIRANQAQYGTLLSEAAAQQYTQDIAKYNADVEAYNAAENRKYQQASDNVDAYINLLGKSGQSQETKSAVSSYTKRLNKLQDRLDKLNTEYTIDEKNGKEVLKSRTSKGKKEVQAITNQIAQINNQLAALGAI